MVEEPKWLIHARKDSGLAELPGADHNPRILEMFKHTSYGAKSDEVAWCSAAMCCWMDEVGIGGTNNAAAHSWMNWGEPLTEPVLGCVCVFGNPNSWTGHVALFVSEPNDGHTIVVYGGNQSNKVCQAGYLTQNLLGFRWPKGVPVEAAKPVDAPQSIATTIPADSVLVKLAALTKLQSDLASMSLQMDAIKEVAKRIRL